MRRDARKHYRDSAKNELQRIMDSFSQTILIGCLHEFEQGFGHLFGHDKEDRKDLTNEEREMRKIWMRVRTRMLDHGHWQFEQLYDKIDERFNFEKKRYTWNFKLGDHND